ncbi:nucleotidyltransferase family protein [Spirochaeta thermophila]|uniref:Polymerase beta nucleotidyltransferase domain-containing protein n=1 Tax=Winmispira thermophila (strain ATCC 49972 / DSM 6192 / RI 19.B1) TaxID=665571 RepID=E0RNN8_WINT6|nr:nucleotidyltransferase domain-containing protein [Spirochaeta thermophila]ADN02629.1 hypothetical protein STHERM_c16910 [Spirochaeta thermophila DSM 6192]
MSITHRGKDMGEQVAKETIRTAKAVIEEEVEKAGFHVARILLFGSRARGDSTAHSDWDFYVVVDTPIDFPTKRRVAGSIQMRLAEQHIFCDIIIQSREAFAHLSRSKNTVSYLARTEGIRI